MEEQLFLAWDKYNDAQAIVPLIENGLLRIDSHSEIIETILNDDNVEDWIERKIFLLLARADIESINYLKDTNPVTYLYIATKLKIEVDDAYILKTLEEIDDYSLLGLVVWCLGKMGKREILLKLSIDIDKIIKRIFKM